MIPRIFAISPERPFLDTLAGGLLALAGDDPLDLSRITVLLPTRRAVRSLREAFLRAPRRGGAAGAPLLLPRMRPVGDLDDDEFGIDEGAADADALSVPPAVPELRRRLLLARRVLAWGGAGDLLPGQAVALAGALARLLDSVATEGASFDRLRDLVPAELAEHWQAVFGFLEILPREWPDTLGGEGAIDPAERRNRLIRRQAAQWRRAPPAEPVIAAGLGGGIPALAELAAVVAELPRGAVILAGLDRSCAAAEWSAIAGDETHPQHLLALLLRALAIDPADIREWPAIAAAPVAAPRAHRIRLVAQALRPAVFTDGWRQLPAEPPAVLAGLARYDCASPQDEAVTIALLLRRKLDTAAATAALVTPDRELARRVAAELRRWGIAIDDSAGVPLNRTPPGTFLRLVLDLADSTLAPVPLLAALKHPLAAGGLAPGAFRDLARRLDRELRGPRPAPGFAGLDAALAGADAVLRGFAGRLRACLGELPELLAAEHATVAELAAAHIAAAERLAESNGETGAARLWAEAAGEAAARFCHELIDAARDFPALPGRHYAALFEALAAGTVVRPTYGRHPRLAIWGLLEARLQQADLVVLGGLNEGTWPGIAAHDPWMSRPMRREFGIAVPERAIGSAAHDFVQALAAPEVALTRAARRDGAPTVPSRWLLRLDAVLRAVGLYGALGPDPEIANAAALVDLPGQYRPLPPAAPRPPLTARPRQLPVTQVEAWLRDPYAIYARHVLRLRPLPEIDEDPGRAELGVKVHAALDAFVGCFPGDLPGNAEDRLLEIGRESFGAVLSRPGAWAFWWPRFERVARWFVAEERARRPDIIERLSERSGALIIAAPGGPFVVTAKADRIDRLADGGLLIVDYKTGGVPPNKEVEAGYAVQLPLEGAIIRDGSFAGISGVATALEYWRVNGGDPPGERLALGGGGDPAALIDRVLARVTALIARFDDPDTPYLPVPAARWRPRFSDFAHLERRDDGGGE